MDGAANLMCFLNLENLCINFHYVVYAEKLNNILSFLTVEVLVINYVYHPGSKYELKVGLKVPSH